MLPPGPPTGPLGSQGNGVTAPPGPGREPERRPAADARRDRAGAVSRTRTLIFLVSGPHEAHDPGYDGKVYVWFLGPHRVEVRFTGTALEVWPEGLSTRAEKALLTAGRERDGGVPRWKEPPDEIEFSTDNCPWIDGRRDRLSEPAAEVERELETEPHLVFMLERNRGWLALVAHHWRGAAREGAAGCRDSSRAASAVDQRGSTTSAATSTRSTGWPGCPSGCGRS